MTELEMGGNNIIYYIRISQTNLRNCSSYHAIVCSTISVCPRAVSSRSLMLDRITVCSSSLCHNFSDERINLSGITKLSIQLIGKVKYYIVINILSFFQIGQ